MTTEITNFRERLLLAFPPEPFGGPISIHDECSEGIALRRELPGKRWTEIPTAFLDYNSLSLPLLEPGALVAFLPAWLFRAVETLGDEEESLVPEFTLYFLCPGTPEKGWDENKIAQLVALFDRAQRSLLSKFLQLVIKDDALRHWHPDAEHGLRWWV